jgi:hypothetical protein
VGAKHFGEHNAFINPEGGGNMHPQNFDTHLLDYTSSQPERPKFISLHGASNQNADKRSDKNQLEPSMENY